jgi:hypothetical protein
VLVQDLTVPGEVVVLQGGRTEGGLGIEEARKL